MEMVSDAYNSLLGVIHDLLFTPRISVASSSRDILFFAFSLVISLGTKLEDCSEGVMGLNDRTIAAAICKLEDAIEFAVSTQFLSQSQGSERCPSTFSLNLDHLRLDVLFFAKTAQIFEECTEKLWEQNVRQMIEEYVLELFVPKELLSSNEQEEEDVEMIGLSDEFLQIRDKLGPYDGAVWKRIAIWISGMAGIGKTRLAKKLFHDPWVKENFESRAFVRVGKEYWRQEILQDITAQLNLDNQKIIMEGDCSFEESLIRILTARKSRIVLDDVWDPKFLLDFMLKVYGKSGIKDAGSRILVTSRNDACDSSHFWDLKVRFLDKEESWELLKRKVFGEEQVCPQELVKAGKKIAKKCEGLPLLIHAVAPILISKAQKNPEIWKRVAEKPNSVVEEASLQISEALLSSYHRISDVLKHVFLYIAAFPQNYLVWCPGILMLWYAEGLFHHSTSQSDQVAQNLIVFRELVENNLIMSIQESRVERNKTKAFKLHCAYWFASKRIAENKKFLYIINSHADGLVESVKSHRRLAIYKNILLAVKEVHTKMACISTIRSLLCTGPYHQYQVPLCSKWKLLRVLDALTIRFYEFPVEIVKLVRLRYLALTCDASLSPSISKLWNLQYLIVHQHLSIKRAAAQSYVPVEIWDLQELIHLKLVGRNLPDPHPGKVLPKLLKLLDVGVQSCSRSVFESIPKLKKLRVQIESDVAETFSWFDQISCLDELKSFQSVIMNPTLFHPPPPLPSFACCLRKLTLSGFGYPWEDTSPIAELHGLYKLKLQCYAFQGERWEVEGKGFPCLGYLLIEDTDLVQWRAGDESFRVLRRLTMKNCYELEEIPRFELCECVELVDCNPSAEICVKQRYRTAERIEVNVNYSWEDKKKLKSR